MTSKREKVINTITLPQLAWYGSKKLELSLPDSWSVESYNMAGYNRPAMKIDEIKTSIANPIGITTIRELARGKNEVVIIFDDMTRVTRAAEIVPFVLEELSQAGIPDNKIRFICALGCHGVHDRLDFSKKLGEEILARFPVYNHNPFAHCTYVGTTNTYGTKVYVSEEVMKCDLKIAIGSVVPHPMSGFGGGGKIILPGVASFETIEHNHGVWSKDAIEHRGQPIVGMGVFDNNPMRFDVEEAATLAGLDVLINCIVNMWGETVAVFAGALVPAYATAVDEAKTHYRTPKAKGESVIIANTFAKANEAIMIGLGAAFSSVSLEGGDVVLIANAPDGHVTHYLLGTFGRTTAGPQRSQARIPQHVNHVIIYSEYPDLAGRGYIEESDKVMFMNNWDAVLQVLQEFHGAEAKVAVYPNADIQYL
ncbi:lactate racemase domain-containing protein [Chloroflexota bacterium]